MTHLEREGWWATKQVVMSLSKSWCWINSLIEQNLSLIYKADGVPEMAVAAMPAQLGTEWTNLNSHLMFSCFFHPRCQTRVAALLIILAANHPALPALCMSVGNQKSWIPVWEEHCWNSTQGRLQVLRSLFPWLTLCGFLQYRLTNISFITFSQHSTTVKIFVSTVSILFSLQHWVIHSFQSHSNLMKNGVVSILILQ